MKKLQEGVNLEEPVAGEGFVSDWVIVNRRDGYSEFSLSLRIPGYRTEDVYLTPEEVTLELIIEQLNDMAAQILALGISRELAIDFLRDVGSSIADGVGLSSSEKAEFLSLLHV